MKDLSQTELPERVRMDISKVVRELYPIHCTLYGQKWLLRV